MKNIYIYYQHTQGDHPLKEQLHKIWHFDELFFFKISVGMTGFIRHCFSDLFYPSSLFSFTYVFITLYFYTLVWNFHWKLNFFSEYTYVKYIILNHHHFWWKLIELFAAKFYIHTKKSIFWYIKNQKVAHEKSCFLKNFCWLFLRGRKKRLIDKSFGGWIIRLLKI